MSNVAIPPPPAAHPAPAPATAPPVNPPRSIPMPLLPVAIALTAGIVLDRAFQPPLALAAIGFAIASITWLSGWRRASPISVVWLWLAVVFLGSSWHRVCHLPSPHDISRYADEQGRLVRVRGWVWS